MFGLFGSSDDTTTLRSAGENTNLSYDWSDDEVDELFPASFHDDDDDDDGGMSVETYVRNMSLFRR